MTEVDENIRGDGRYMKKQHGYRKPDLVNKIVEITGYHPTKVTKITDAVFDAIIQLTKDGQPLFIQGFGSFRMHKLGERTIEHHFVSGDKATSPAHWKLSFKDYDSLISAAGKDHRRRSNRRFGAWGEDAEEMIMEFVRRAEETRKKRLKAEAEARRQAKLQEAQCTSSQEESES